MICTLEINILSTFIESGLIRETSEKLIDIN